MLFFSKKSLYSYFVLFGTEITGLVTVVSNVGKALEPSIDNVFNWTEFQLNDIFEKPLISLKASAAITSMLFSKETLPERFLQLENAPAPMYSSVEMSLLGKVTPSIPEPAKALEPIFFKIVISIKV